MRADMQRHADLGLGMQIGQVKRNGSRLGYQVAIVLQRGREPMRVRIARIGFTAIVARVFHHHDLPFHAQFLQQPQNARRIGAGCVIQLQHHVSL